MYDVIVVGPGAMGSAAIADIAARGRKLLGIEAHHPAHALSSSHGDSRESDSPVTRIPPMCRSSGAPTATGAGSKPRS